MTSQLVEENTKSTTHLDREQEPGEAAAAGKIGVSGTEKAHSC
jgi:hypothetical protein